MSKDDKKPGKLGPDADAIRELSQLLNETGLTEIEIDHNGARIRVSRAAVNAVMGAAAAPAPAAAAPAPAAASSGPPAGAVPSPMVGTVYLSPEPGKPAFISIGKTVKAGDTLFIVEAMKTMNPITAPHGGTVKEISVSDKDPVEFGQNSLRHRLMFEKVLIANRGEIALRVIRACKEMGIATVAIHSTADSDAMHVRLADESVCVGPPPGGQSYLNMAAIIAACEITGAEAIHPGYGFLSENAKFAEIVAEHGLTFIGPTADHIRMMGDKITAKQTVKELGIPTVPGSDGAVNDEDAPKIAQEIGYPVLIKATAGGGGRGMKVAKDAGELSFALSQARAEAKSAFGNDMVYMEKYLQKPRHIEIQILADAHGKVVHLGERDCSLQRRHQKVWEEAGSPALNARERDDIGGICTRALEKLGYLGAGTIEFLYEDGRFYFIEMNTRLQVEHPVTEAITGIDIVREQIRIASGAAMDFTQKDIIFEGHAIECRINAEHPFTFRPSPGQITQFHTPGGLGVRFDSAIYAGYRIPPYYDSLAGKLIVHARNRNECLLRLRRALDELVVGGIETTIPLFQGLVRDPDILNGDYSIHWLEKYLAGLGH